MRRSPKPRPLLTFGVVNYNGADVLPETLSAISATSGENDEILMADDGSDDGSPEWAKDRYESLRVLRMERHTGQPNILRNRLLREARHRLVFLVDNDVILHPGCVERLSDVVAGSPDVLCATPRLLYHGNPERIYHDGGGLHFLCLSTASARGEAAASRPPGRPYPTVGCGIMLVDHDLATRIGGFDERCQHGWGEDGEFHFRGRIAGLRVLHVPDATCEHVARDHGRGRVTGQLYNRYRLLLTDYSTASLVLLSPVLLAFEVALTAGSVVAGFWKARCAALARVVSERDALLERRRTVQSMRRLPDSTVLRPGAWTLPDSIARSRWAETGTRLARLLLDGYWRPVRALLDRLGRRA